MACLTADTLRSMLNYDPACGTFTWKQANSNRVKVGAVAGCRCKKSDYTVIGINGRVYKASRLAFLFMTGSWPSELVDHINLDRSDDRWKNLRLASASDNRCNQTKLKINTSGYKGVNWNSQRGKWEARATKNGKTTRFGFFNCPTTAAIAYRNNVSRVQGEYARTE